MEQRNLACKTCGTKIFKTPQEVDSHHKETHPEVQNPDNGQKINKLADDSNGK